MSIARKTTFLVTYIQENEIMNKQLNNKVVYGWYHEDQIFYVGIGTINRSKSKRGRNTYCKRKREKAERENSFEVKILFFDLDFEQACKKEIELIKQYGRKDLGTGCLTNLTNGGEGLSNCSEETRNKLIQAKTGKRHPNYGKTLSDETKKRIGKANSKRMKEAWERGDFDHRKGYTHEPETIEIMKEQKKRGKHPRAKPVETPLGIFECGADAAEAHEISKMKLSRRVKSRQFPDYKLLEQD